MTHNDAALAAWLTNNDAACPVCSYNLRGLGLPRCPECSAPLHLCVGSDHLIAGPWVFAVLSFGLAIGFDSVVAILMTIALVVGTIAEGPPPPGMLYVLVGILAGFYTLVALGVLGIWLLLRRRKAWLRQEPRRQWRLAAIIFVTVGLVHALYGFAVWFMMSRF